jgi:sensor domain CHASE-containing protein
MVRRRACAVSNHEASPVAFILRDAAKAPLLRMRVLKRQDVTSRLNGGLESGRSLSSHPHGEEARCAVSNHEASPVAFILRDAAKTPLLRMRVSPRNRNSSRVYREVESGRRVVCASW